MNQGQPVRPANIAHIVAINQGKAPLTMQRPRVPALSPQEVQDRIDDGCAVVDTRSSADFGSAHVPGAYNLQVGSAEFEQRFGWVVPMEAPVVLVAANSAAVDAALQKLAFLGLDHRIEGSLEGGMGAWIAAGMPCATVPQMSVTELHERLSGNGMRTLDVREPDEYREGHIAGAGSMSFKILEQHLDEIGVGPDDTVAVVCAGGIRSGTACSILQRNGFRRVHNVTGGMGAWRAAGLPTVTDRPGAHHGLPEGG